MKRQADSEPINFGDSPQNSASHLTDLTNRSVWDETIAYGMVYLRLVEISP
jgi:hypothetical protein